MPDGDSTRESALYKRIEELNRKCTQVLTFLSFVLAASVIAWSSKRLTPAQTNLALHAIRWWLLAIFPTALGVAPFKEFGFEKPCWYEFLRWMKFFILWAALVLIGLGAASFLGVF